MTGFVQIVEWKTSRIDEVRAMTDEYSAQRGSDAGPVRVTVVADRDQPNTYLTIAEFGSHEEAMANSDNPTTSEFAKRMMGLCDGPPAFRNADVVHQEQRR